MNGLRSLRPQSRNYMNPNCSSWLKRVASLLTAAVFAFPGTGLALHGWAQDAATTVSVDVKVVTLPVTVRDKHGKIIRDLAKDDFTLQEDGRPETIKYFSQETNLPLTLGLLVDTSRSQTNVLDAERNASRSFVDQMLTQGKDKAFLIHFDRQVELLQDLTSSREKLQAGLELLKTSEDNSNDPKDPSNSPDERSRPRGGTQLYDAVYLASNELMKKQQGRKALIILSDGVDRGSKTFLDGAIESAQRADTVIYSIYFAEPRHEHDRDNRDRQGGMGRGGGGWPGGGGGGWPGGEAGIREADEEVPAGIVVTKSRTPTARKSWRRCPKRRAGVFLKFPRNKRLARSTTALQKNCGLSTAWATRRTRIAKLPATIMSC